MTRNHTLSLLSLAILASLSATPAMAQDSPYFYGGFGLGSSKSKLDQDAQSNALLPITAIPVSIDKNNQDTACLSEKSCMLVKIRPDERGGCPEKYKNDRKTENKGQRMQHCRLAHLVCGMLSLEIGKRESGKIRNIGRYQREDAG